MASSRGRGTPAGRCPYWPHIPPGAPAPGMVTCGMRGYIGCRSESEGQREEGAGHMAGRKRWQKGRAVEDRCGALLGLGGRRAACGGRRGGTGKAAKLEGWMGKAEGARSHEGSGMAHGSSVARTHHGPDGEDGRGQEASNNTACSARPCALRLAPSPFLLRVKYKSSHTVHVVSQKRRVSG
jgi:hypothetical protein